jgi:hypothetical protein
MPAWLEVVLIVIVAIIVLLAVGGAIAVAARGRRREGQFAREVEQVNRALAHAHASDKGWERAGLERAARAAVERERPDVTVDELVLIQVVDPPGTERDKAIFRVVAGDERLTLTLGRHDDDWHNERLQ